LLSKDLLFLLFCFFLAYLLNIEFSDQDLGYEGHINLQNYK